MTIAAGNLFVPMPADSAAESITTLFGSPRIRVERIVSHGQASPPGFWYDQDWDEWVVVLSGEAGLLIAGEASPRPMRAGDYLLIPAHLRHRVEWTLAGAPTVWLAVHDGAAS